MDVKAESEKTGKVATLEYFKIISALPEENHAIVQVLRCWLLTVRHRVQTHMLNSWRTKWKWHFLLFSSPANHFPIASAHLPPPPKVRVSSEILHNNTSWTSNWGGSDLSNTSRRDSIHCSFRILQMAILQLSYWQTPLNSGEYNFDNLGSVDKCSFPCPSAEHQCTESASDKGKPGLSVR